MKISCELCRKSFDIPEKKLTARGTTVYCPRCNHPHLIKRVVEAYPVDEKFKVPDKDYKPPVPVTTTRGAAHVEDGVLRLHEPPPPPKVDKAKYHWRKLLSWRRREKRSQTIKDWMQTTRSVWGWLARIAFLAFFVIVALGILYFEKLPESEREIYTQKVKDVLDRLNGMVRRGSP